MFWVIGLMTIHCWRYRWVFALVCQVLSSGLGMRLAFTVYASVCPASADFPSGIGFPIQDLCIMRVIRWTAGKTSSFEPLNFIQLIFCRSLSENGCLNLFRLFPLQISTLQFCFSNLLVYLNGSMFPLSSVFLYSSPMFCFSSNFSSDSFRHFWVWSH